MELTLQSTALSPEDLQRLDGLNENLYTEGTRPTCREPLRSSP